MSGEDLDSFFAEISQITAEAGPSAGFDHRVEQTAAVSKPQVISKPAEISSVAVAKPAVVSSHPIYTYAQPEFLANANFNYEYEQQPEPQFFHNVTAPDSRPPPPAVAPPQVPRQNKVCKHCSVVGVIHAHKLLCALTGVCSQGCGGYVGGRNAARVARERLQNIRGRSGEGNNNRELGEDLSALQVVCKG
jgi:hypothetical protein